MALIQLALFQIVPYQECGIGLSGFLFFLAVLDSQSGNADEEVNFSLFGLQFDKNMFKAPRVNRNFV